MKMRAILSTGGLGSRFFPISVVTAKAMLPILNTPILDYAIRECLAGGITDMAVMYPEGDRQIADYLNHTADRAAIYSRAGMASEYAALRSLHEGCDLMLAASPRTGVGGSAIPLVRLRDYIDASLFYLMAVDDLVLRESDPPPLPEMVDLMTATNADAVIGSAVMRGPRCAQYGNVVVRDGIWLERIIEKPGDPRCTTGVVFIGRLLSSPVVADLARQMEVSPKTGELQIVDAINLLAATHRVAVHTVESGYFDCGIPADWLRANARAFELSLKSTPAARAEWHTHE